MGERRLQRPKQCTEWKKRQMREEDRGNRRRRGKDYYYSSSGLAHVLNGNHGNNCRADRQAVLER